MLFRSRKGLFITIGVLIIGILLFILWPNTEQKPNNNQLDNNQNSNQNNSETVTFNHNLEGVNTSYISNMNIDTNAREINGTIQVRTINDTGKLQDKIYFHLYPNAFRDSEKLTGEIWESVLGNNPKPGWIDIHEVKVNGNTAKIIVRDSILEIPLSNWDVDKEVDIEIKYFIKVPKNELRFSYDDNSIWLGNWLPIRVKYDEDGWNLDPYYPMGDPFYSDVANYQLSVEVPDGYQVASSGIDGTGFTETSDGNRLFTITAKKVRDFAMSIMDDNYKMLRCDVNDTEVRTWFLNTDSESTVNKLHESSCKSISYFSKQFGAYPYAEYDVIRTGGFFGGMEYPGLVYIVKSLFEQENPFGGIGTIAHETAHQWWYGVVGNDEVEEPWLDESLTHYSELQFLMSEYPQMGDYEIERREISTDRALEYEQKGIYVGSAITAFTDWRSYSQLVYSKGSQMFYHLEKAIGTKKMNEALNTYYEKFKFKNATGEDLIRTFEEVVGPNVRDYFHAWLNGKKVEYKQ